MEDDHDVSGLAPLIIDTHPSRLQRALQTALRMTAGMASRFVRGDLSRPDELVVAADLSSEEGFVVVPLVLLIDEMEQDFYGNYCEPTLPQARAAAQELRAIAAHCERLANKITTSADDGEWPEEYSECPDESDADQA